MFEIEHILAVMKAFDRISGKGFQNLPVFFFRIFLEIDENFQRDMVDQNTDDWVGKIFFFSQMFFILISISSFVFGTVTNNKKKIKLKKFKKSKPRYLSILRLLSNSSAIQRPEKFTGSQPRLAAISILCDWNYLHSLFRGSHNMTQMIKIKKIKFSKIIPVKFVIELFLRFWVSLSTK